MIHNKDTETILSELKGLRVIADTNAALLRKLHRETPKESAAEPRQDAAQYAKAQRYMAQRNVLAAALRRIAKASYLDAAELRQMAQDAIESAEARK